MITYLRAGSRYGSRSESWSKSRSGFKSRSRSESWSKSRSVSWSGSGSGYWSGPKSRSKFKSRSRSWSESHSRSDLDPIYAQETTLINTTPIRNLPLLIGQITAAQDYLEKILKLPKE